MLVNLAMAVLCALAAWSAWDVGLGAMTRIYLGYYAVLLGAYAGVGAIVGADGRRARPLRLAADIGNWLGLAGFAVFGLAVYEPRETGPVVTFVAFLAAVVTISVAKHVRTTRATRS